MTLDANPIDSRGQPRLAEFDDHQSAILLEDILGFARQEAANDPLAVAEAVFRWRRLVAHGANPNAESRVTGDALGALYEEGRFAAAEALIGLGARFSRRLHCEAIAEAHTADAVDYLIAKGVSLTEPVTASHSTRARTLPYLFASARNFPGLLRMLDLGVDVFWIRPPVEAEVPDSMSNPLLAAGPSTKFGATFILLGITRGFLGINTPIAGFPAYVYAGCLPLPDREACLKSLFNDFTAKPFLWHQGKNVLDELRANANVGVFQYRPYPAESIALLQQWLLATEAAKAAKKSKSNKNTQSENNAPTAKAVEPRADTDSAPHVSCGSCPETAIVDDFLNPAALTVADMAPAIAPSASIEEKSIGAIDAVVAASANSFGPRRL